MSKSGIAVALATLMALVAATMWVPVEWGELTVEPVPTEAAAAHERLVAASAELPERVRRARERRFLSEVGARYGEWGPESFPHAAPRDHPTYEWIWWVRRWRSPVPVKSKGRLLRVVVWGPRVRWPVLVLEQGLILLVGGGLLSVLIRRERRRRAGLVAAEGDV